MDKDIIPMLKARYKSKFIFQQDNARPHTSKTAKDIFMKKSKNVNMATPQPRPIDYRKCLAYYEGSGIWWPDPSDNKTELWEKITMVAAAINEENPSKIKALYSSIIIDNYQKIFRCY